MVISNHNSFQVMFDKIASVYFIWKKNTYNLAIKMASPREPALCHAMDVMLAHNGQYLVLEIESCARTNSQKGRILLLAGSIGLLHLSYIAALQ